MPTFVFLTFACSLIAAPLAAESPGRDDDGEWIELFDGTSLDGWVAHLGDRGDETSLTLDEIFTVQDGTIHTYKGAANRSKQYSANLRTEATFSRYHLKVEYRWLENRFRPRHASVRDAGIMFHIHSDIGAVWPPCLEMQLGEGQPYAPYVTGDLWVLGPTRATSRSKDLFYDPEAPPMLFGETGKADLSGRSNYTFVTVEKTKGEWQVAEVIVHGAERAEFYLNGTLMNVATDLQFQDADGNWQPLESGHISLQAEWAELQYRSVKLKKLCSSPDYFRASQFTPPL